LLFGTETVGQGEQAACIETSLESPVVFMKSGITCQGSQLDEGSITCSSEPPEKPLSTETCVTHNRNPITFVEDRCDCSGSTPGCGFGPGGGIDFVQ
jgi:hypothetical protein